MSASAEPNPAPAAAPGSMKRWVLAALLLPLAGVAGYYGWKASRVPAPLSSGEAEHSLLRLDLTRPDALIESQSLAALPRDLLDLPVLRDLLSEDFVFYYEGHPDRLGILGSLRRIAYEHELEWQDSLLAELLDQPAEVALWRGSDGKLKHAALRIRRGALAKLLQPLGKAAASDTQLSVVGLRRIDGDEVPVYRLRYNYDRAILFAAHDDELLVLTSPGLLQSGDDPASPPGSEAARQLDEWLSGEVEPAERFGLDERESKHRISIAADYLALGYGRFLPQLAGVRFEQDDDGWHSFAALNDVAAPALEFAPLWQAMPIGAAVCAAVPVSEAALGSLFTRLGAAQAMPAELAAQLKGPAALCWYPESRLSTPLLVTTLATPAVEATDGQLQSLFDALIGAYEPNQKDGRFPVERSNGEAHTRFSRIVGSDWGLHADTELPDPAAISSSRWFNVALARHGQQLLFSLDDRLVDKALNVLDKRFPPLAEQLPAQGAVPLVLAPEALARLVEQETLASLPAEVETVFRNAAQAHLLPKLRAFSTHPAYALSLPPGAKAGKGWTWLPLSWNAL